MTQVKVKLDTSVIKEVSDNFPNLILQIKKIIERIQTLDPHKINIDMNIKSILS